MLRNECHIIPLIFFLACAETVSTISPSDLRSRLTSCSEILNSVKKVDFSWSAVEFTKKIKNLRSVQVCLTYFGYSGHVLGFEASEAINEDNTDKAKEMFSTVSTFSNVCGMIKQLPNVLDDLDKKPIYATIKPILESFTSRAEICFAHWKSAFRQPQSHNLKRKFLDNYIQEYKNASLRIYAALVKSTGTKDFSDNLLKVAAMQARNNIYRYYKFTARMMCEIGLGSVLEGAYNYYSHKRTRSSHGPSLLWQQRIQTLARKIAIGAKQCVETVTFTSYLIEEFNEEFELAAKMTSENADLAKRIFVRLTDAAPHLAFAVLAYDQTTGYENHAFVGKDEWYHTKFRKFGKCAVVSWYPYTETAPSEKEADRKLTEVTKSINQCNTWNSDNINKPALALVEQLKVDVRLVAVINGELKPKVFSPDGSALKYSSFKNVPCFSEQILQAYIYG